MKICEAWLREWINPPLSVEELAAQLTMAGLEVDSIVPVAGQFHHVVVAKVLQATPHPEADKLTICSVDFGSKAPLQVICGASNVRTGLIVALALPGASLPNGMIIKETKLRGELSQGMLCSASELGLQESSEGILELPDLAPLGSDLREYMALDGSILDIDLTPNRADCFSLLGIAREVATLNKLPLNERTYSAHQPVHDETLPVYLDEPNACPQYYGRVIRDINPDAISPLWLLERLRRAGIRSIHPVVDVTNYVMLELGQPMHAFNKDALKGAIHVRYSRKGESLVLLDDQTVELHERTLVIADEEKPLAIAGVMGGSESAINFSSTNIFLESAFFNPVQLAGVARRYGLCTESSQRFERGVDPSLQVKALDYATTLLLSIVGGKVGPVVSVQVARELPTVRSIAFNPSHVERLTGVIVSEEEMQSTLRSLGMTVDSKTLPWIITAPSHRFDITLDVDLVEEIIRIYGYDKIATHPITATLHPGVVNPLEQLTKKIAWILSGRGYHEIISYSFADPDIQQAICPDDQPMTLQNPISPELAQMRTSLWPGLIASLVYNSNRQQPLIKIFESGVVFDNSNNVLKEKVSLAGLSAGQLGAMSWCESTRKLDFYDLKGDVQALFSTLNINDIHYVPASHPGLHPGQSAQIFLGKTSIGWIGLLHPELIDALDLSADVVMFEIMLEGILQKNIPTYKKISKFPSVRRDLSFLIDRGVSAMAVEQSIREVVEHGWLKAFDVFDIYSGESIPADKKSLAIALTLQDDHRTLVDDEVKNVIDTVIKKLNHEFSIILRD
jgi:phenylalanyl-tRNA synthetase beta chain